MKKLFFSIVVVAVMSLWTLSYAQEESRNSFYIGAGGSYAVEDFDGGASYDNSWGANAKIGYHLHPLVDVEFNFDYLFGFKDSQAVPLLGEIFDGDSELKITTYMIGLKGYFPFSTETVKLSVVAGGGIMHADADVKVKGPGLSISDSSNETEMCAKVGLGFDVFATKNISFGAEGNYTLGFDNLEDIRYFNFTVGVAYHF